MKKSRENNAKKEAKKILDGIESLFDDWPGINDPETWPQYRITKKGLVLITGRRKRDA